MNNTLLRASSLVCLFILNPLVGINGSHAASLPEDVKQAHISKRAPTLWEQGVKEVCEGVKMFTASMTVKSATDYVFNGDSEVDRAARTVGDGVSKLGVIAALGRGCQGTFHCAQGWWQGE